MDMFNVLVCFPISTRRTVKVQIAAVNNGSGESRRIANVSHGSNIPNFMKGVHIGWVGSDRLKGNGINVAVFLNVLSVL